MRRIRQRGQERPDGGHRQEQEHDRALGEKGCERDQRGEGRPAQSAPIERRARRHRDGEQPQTRRERQEDGRERVDANDGLSAGNPTERGGANREGAQAGETAMTSAASSMDTADSDRQAPEAFDVKTKRRTRRSRESAGPQGRQATAERHSSRSSPPSTAAGRRARQDDIAQPAIETRQLARESRKGLDHDTVQDAVEESAFERDQKQAAADAIRCQRLRGSRRLETVGRRWRLPSRADRGGRSARSGTAAVESRRVRPGGRTRCVYQPIAISTTMMPTCVREAYASDDFTSLCTRVVIPANTAVAAPRPPARRRAAGACSSSGAARNNRKHPA